VRVVGNEGPGTDLTGPIAGIPPHMIISACGGKIVIMIVLVASGTINTR
jgi:hypothetical protein